MRIVSGKYKGRHFDPPSNITARPTTDFAKESLFNLISNEMDIEGITALDLFAGTGSISYELASRGASHITSVEMAETQLRFIHKVCQTLKIDNIRIVKQEVFRFLGSNSTTYDLVFADPPYQMPNIAELPDRMLPHLKNDGLLIVEHGAKTSFADHPNLYDHRNYGNVHFSFFKQSNGQSEETND